jgi:hypothetical protein
MTPQLEKKNAGCGNSEGAMLFIFQNNLLYF